MMVNGIELGMTEWREKLNKALKDKGYSDMVCNVVGDFTDAFFIAPISELKEVIETIVDVTLGAKIKYKYD